MDEQILLEGTPFHKYLESLQGPKKIGKATKLNEKEFLEAIKVKIPEETATLSQRNTQRTIYLDDILVNLIHRQFLREYISLCRSSVLLENSLSEEDIITLVMIQSKDHLTNSAYSMKPYIRLGAIALILLVFGLFCWHFQLGLIGWTLAILFLCVAFPDIMYILRLNSILNSHSRNLKALESYLKDAAIFFGSIKKGIYMIQEVELVSRGYRLSSTLTPIGRLEKNAKERKAQLLRKIIREALMHLISAYPILDDTHNVTEEYDEDSLLYIKSLDKLARFQCKNVIIKTLTSLSNDTCDSGGEIIRSKTSNTFLNLARVLEPLQKRYHEEGHAVSTTLEHELWIPNIKEHPLSKKENRDDNTFLSLLTKLQHEVSTTNALIVLCKEEYSRFCTDESGDPEILDKSLNALYTHFNKIKENLNCSQEFWIKASEYLSRTQNQSKTGIDTSPNNIESSENSLSLSTELLDEEVKDIRPLLEKMFVIYEAEKADTEDEPFRARSTLSRADRIEMARKERNERQTKLTRSEHRISVIKELKDVLSFREAEESITLTPLNPKSQ